jgi:hypothetical protein
LVKEKQKMSVKSAKDFEIKISDLLEVFRVLGEANQNLREITKVMEVINDDSNVFPVEIKVPLACSINLKIMINDISVHLKPSKQLFFVELNQNNQKNRASFISNPSAPQREQSCQSVNCSDDESAPLSQILAL